MLVLLLLIVVPRPAAAYIDPGTGSLVIQALIAGLVTASVIFRRAFGRVFGGILRLFGRRQPPPPGRT
ncbi:MAG TPA: hypothetical protein PLP50_16165 [Thermoanaerobaculia bacterium]|nr:hypothetical protein [Thermoanaerobaculia bacterium]HPA53128.1 hypothetical protein [Thermoanaerobaculia bacterium]HQN09547.1 hypothetical protein [Thermoanaerobaculia bacterium]HQP88782.1 hypothetical protein [Thermoanaerobaculia bacterium]